MSDYNKEELVMSGLTKEEDFSEETAVDEIEKAINLNDDGDGDVDVEDENEKACGCGFWVEVSPLNI